MSSTTLLTSDRVMASVRARQVRFPSWRHWRAIKPFDGDVAGLTLLRLRRLLCFLRRRNLFDTAFSYVHP
jgi:hypothetical protein